MRIGISAEYLNSNGGGVETYAVNLLRGLSEVEGAHDFVAYVCGRAAERWDGAFDSRVRLRRVGFNRWWAIPVGIPYELARRPVDVYHATFVVPPLCRVPTVLTLHDVSFEEFPEFFPPSVRLRLTTLTDAGIARAHAIAASSEYTKRTICRCYGVDPSLVEVVPLAVEKRFSPSPAPDDVVIRARHGLTQGYLLYVGQVEVRKNLVRLVEAYAALRREHPMPPLVIVGRFHWLYQDVLAAVERRGLGGHVHFLGHVPSGDLPALYRGARLFVFPSRSEGFGIPPLEAMASGVPVVSSNAGALPEAVGDAAVLIDPLDGKALAAAIRDVLASPERRQDLSRRGLAQASLFTWDRVARRMLALYERARDHA